VIANFRNWLIFNFRLQILFLEGIPVVSHLEKVSIGSDVAAQHKNDMNSETEAIATYNSGIKLASEVGDSGTRELLESILKDEEVHLDWLEAQINQISQMGIQNYLADQLG
jgi:bacterioferritin